MAKKAGSVRKPDHNDPSVLNKRIWKCSDPNCAAKGPFDLSGMKIHNTRIHSGIWSRTLRIDGHPMPGEILVAGENVLLRGKGTGSSPARQPSTAESTTATIRFCPCCGIDLTAFNAAASLTMGR